MDEEIDYNHVLPYGKHKGRNIRWLIENDVNYLTWAVENQPALLQKTKQQHREWRGRGNAKEHPPLSQEMLDNHAWEVSLRNLTNKDFDKDQTPFPNIKEGDVGQLQNLKHLHTQLNGKKFPVTLVWLNTVEMEFRVRVQDENKEHIKYAGGLLDVKPDQIVKS